MLLAACFGPAAGARADGAYGPSTGRLAVQVYDDRLTLSTAKVPQVYLYGTIDTDAPERFAALMESSKIPTGSDIYLNSPGGDLNAGLALGRLFRRGSMATHLGTPRRGQQVSSALKTATCTGACAYAYFGGVYRWAPTGRDRLGLPAYRAADPRAGGGGAAADPIAAYLKDMDIDPGAFAATPAGPRDGIVWLAADQMVSTGLANNGRSLLTATYQLSGGAPYLMLSRTDRNGEHRITLLCKPGGITLNAYDKVGADRARQIVRKGMRSYFEIDQQQTLPQQGSGVDVVDQSVMISRLYPSSQLGRLLFAQSIGAWVSDRNSSLRYGFSFGISPLKNILKNYYTSCWQYAPWPTDKKS